MIGYYAEGLSSKWQDTQSSDDRNMSVNPEMLVQYFLLQGMLVGVLPEKMEVLMTAVSQQDWRVRWLAYEKKIPEVNDR